VAEALARSDRALRRGRIIEAQRCLALAAAYRRLAAESEAAERQARKAETADSIDALRTLAAIADAGKAEADFVTAQIKAGVADEDVQTTDELHEVHGVQSLDAQLAALEARIAKRERLGAPANDLRRELRRLRGPPDD
jgi:hypothetical protein